MKKAIIIISILLTVFCQAALNGKWVKLTIDKESVAVGEDDTVQITATFQAGSSVSNGTEVALGLAAETEIDTLDGTATTNNDVAVWIGETKDLPSDWYIPYGYVDGIFDVKVMPVGTKVAVVSIDRVEYYINSDGDVVPPAWLIDANWVNKNLSIGTNVEVFFRAIPYPEDAEWPLAVGDEPNRWPQWTHYLEGNPGTLIDIVGDINKPVVNIEFDTINDYVIKARCGTSNKSLIVSVRSFGINLTKYSSIFVSKGLQSDVLVGETYDGSWKFSGNIGFNWGDPEGNWILECEYVDPVTGTITIANAPQTSTFDDREHSQSHEFTSPALSTSEWNSKKILRITATNIQTATAVTEHEFIVHREHEIDASAPIWEGEYARGASALIQKVPTGEQPGNLYVSESHYRGILIGDLFFDQISTALIYSQTTNLVAGEYYDITVIPSALVFVPPNPADHFVNVIAREIWDTKIYRITKWNRDGTSEVIEDTLEVGNTDIFLHKGIRYKDGDGSTSEERWPSPDPGPGVDDPYYDPYPSVFP